MRDHTKPRVEVQHRRTKKESPREKQRKPGLYSSFITRGPAPFLRPFPPPRSQPRSPSSLTQKPLEGELSQLPLPRGKGKRAGNPRVLFVVSPSFPRRS